MLAGDAWPVDEALCPVLEAIPALSRPCDACLPSRPLPRPRPLPRCIPRPRLCPASWDSISSKTEGSRWVEASWVLAWMLSPMKFLAPGGRPHRRTWSGSWSKSRGLIGGVDTLYKCQCCGALGGVCLADVGCRRQPIWRWTCGCRYSWQGQTAICRD